jgi:hypothetical protein
VAPPDTIPPLCLPSSLHPPATCTSSHPFHSPQSVVFSLFLVLCLGSTVSISLFIHTHAIYIYWSTSQGLFASRSPQQLCRGHHCHFVFLGTSASSLPYSSVPSPKETVHVCALLCISLRQRREAFPVSLPPIVHQRLSLEHFTLAFPSPSNNQTCTIEI